MIQNVGVCLHRTAETTGNGKPALSMSHIFPKMKKFSNFKLSRSSRLPLPHLPSFLLKRDLGFLVHHSGTTRPQTSWTHSLQLLSSKVPEAKSLALPSALPSRRLFASSQKEKNQRRFMRFLVYQMTPKRLSHRKMLLGLQTAARTLDCNGFQKVRILEVYNLHQLSTTLEDSYVLNTQTLDV